MAKKTDVIKMPPKTVLTSLLSKSKEAKGELDSIKGAMGERISSAVEKHNLHAGAFKLVGKLERMDAVKLAAWLVHFDDYRMKLELDKMAAPDLPGMDDGDGEKKPPAPMFDETKATGEQGVGLDGQPATVN